MRRPTVCVKSAQWGGMASSEDIAYTDIRTFRWSPSSLYHPSLCSRKTLNGIMTLSWFIKLFKLIWDGRSDWSWPSANLKVYITLQWRHNGNNGVSNHQPRHCLLNRLSRRRSKKTSLAFVRGIHRWPVNSPHKGPVTRKMLPFDDVIMVMPEVEYWMGSVNTGTLVIRFKSDPLAAFLRFSSLRSKKVKRAARGRIWIGLRHYLRLIY